MMFRIKICGLTSVADAQTAADAGADAIGLNFYARSPRCVSVETARAISDALPDGVVKVGVFVNASADEIRQIVAQANLDAVQLHGDEPPELLGELTEFRLIRAFRPAKGLDEVTAWLRACQRLGNLPAMALIDAYQKDQYGGTGERADWQQLASGRSELLQLPIVLAGGLTPHNVAQAIAVARPDAVDTASGVETAPGVKSAELMRQFVSAARQAFAQLEASR